MPFGQCCPNLGFHCFSNKIGIGMVLVLQKTSIFNLLKWNWSYFDLIWTMIQQSQNHFKYLGVVEPIKDTAICKSKVSTISISSQISTKEYFSHFDPVKIRSESWVLMNEDHVTCYLWCLELIRWINDNHLWRNEVLEVNSSLIVVFHSWGNSRDSEKSDLNLNQDPSWLRLWYVVR